MPVHDLTPQLRTRLSRLEKLVGWFVTIATLLLLVGLGYYVYSLAERKGWFLSKAPYFTYLRSGAGIRVGGTVRLMGFDAGKITKVVPEKPGAEYNVYVEFVVHEPNFGYIWDDSVVNVKSAGFLGDRFLEISKGGTRRSTNLHATFKEDQSGRPIQIWDQEKKEYANWQKGGKAYWLPAEEPPELGSQMDEVIQTVKMSLTNILALTNALTRTLTNAAEATGNLNEILTAAKPLVTNLNVIAANLKEPRGALGEWILPTNMHVQITSLLTNADAALVNVNSTVTNANTNLGPVFSNITVALENLASMTSNLNSQVQRNTNILSSVSQLVVDTDEMVQGLKRHWLLRSAFKNKQGRNEPTGGQQSGTSTESNRSQDEPLRPQAPKGAGREP